MTICRTWCNWTAFLPVLIEFCEVICWFIPWICLTSVRLALLLFETIRVSIMRIIYIYISRVWALEDFFFFDMVRVCIRMQEPTSLGKIIWSRVDLIQIITRIYKDYLSPWRTSHEMYQYLSGITIFKPTSRFIDNSFRRALLTPCIHHTIYQSSIGFNVHVIIPHIISCWFTWIHFNCSVGDFLLIWEIEWIPQIPS